MFGFFGTSFGRSTELQTLDQALTDVGLPKRALPDAVKYAALRQIKEEMPGGKLPPAAYGDAAELLGYCALGHDGFLDATDPERTRAVEQRIETALQMTDSLDARLVLLTLHAGVIQASVVHAFDLAVEGE
jgi:DNA-binding NarL/FixJ family response regulator